jgi:hypothetical protein
MRTKNNDVSQDTQSQSKGKRIGTVEKPGHKPPRNKTDVEKAWDAALASFGDSQMDAISKEYGWAPEYCAKQRAWGGMGWHKGNLAYPIRDPMSGEVLAIHYRRHKTKEPRWSVDPQGVSPMHPLIIGDPAKAQVAHIFESTSDMHSFCERFGVERTGSRVAIATRGVDHTKKLKGGLGLPADCPIYLWPQNDKPKNPQEVPASERWFDGACDALDGRPLSRATTPAPHRPERLDTRRRDAGRSARSDQVGLGSSAETSQIKHRHQGRPVR